VQADTLVPDLFNPQSLNRYSYVLNNPLKYVDPSGHWVVEDPDDPAPGGAVTDPGDAIDSLYDGAASATDSLGQDLNTGYQDAPNISDELYYYGYSPWEIKILKAIYANGGPEGKDTVEEIVENGRHIKIGEPFRVVTVYTPFLGHTSLFLGDWQSLFEVDGWWHGNDIYLHPNEYSYDEIPDLWGLQTVAHENLHLTQGYLFALTQNGEMEAWQYGLTVFQNLGGVIVPRSRDEGVLQATTVEAFTEVIKEKDPVYWRGLKLLPPWFHTPFQLFEFDGSEYRSRFPFE
jgi:hypothetical protein